LRLQDDIVPVSIKTFDRILTQGLIKEHLAIGPFWFKEEATEVKRLYINPRKTD
jgi:hypothetical protein